MRRLNGWRLAPQALALTLALAFTGASRGTTETEAKAAASSPAYTSDLRAYLNAVHWYERSLAALPRNGDAFEREFVTAFLASMTADQYYAKALPVFARHIPPKEAQTLGAMARKRPVPLGKQQAALTSYWAMEKQAGPELALVWRDLSGAFARRMQERAYAEIRRSIADLADHRGTEYMPDVHKVGLPVMDRIAWLVVNNFAQSARATQPFDTYCRNGPIQTAFQPSTLLANNGLGSAHQVLDDCEHALETMEKLNDAAYNDLRAGLEAINRQRKFEFVQQLDANSRKYYDFGLKLGEMNRQMLQGHRDLLALIEARRAHIQLEGERLMFDSDADVAEFNRKVSDMAALEKSINDLVYQYRQRGILHDIDLHDGVTAPEAPAPQG